MMSPRIDDEDVLCELFTYLDLSDLASCVRVCSQWYDVLSDEDSSVWETQFQKLVPAKVKKSKIIDSCKTYKEKLITYLHSWNPDDCSKNIYIKDDGFTYHRRAVAQSTDAARSRIGFQSGRHCWDVWWEQSMGSHAVVGVALKQAPMQDRGYISLVGNNLYSWGWNLVDNLLYHNGRSNGKFPKFHLPQIDTGVKVRVLLDCEEGTLSFEKDGKFLGVAFSGLPTDQELYATASSVYGETEVVMVYRGWPLDG